MKINFLGTVHRVRTGLTVWGRPLHTQVIVANGTVLDDAFWEEQFIPHLHNAIALLGEDKSILSAIAAQGMDDPSIRVRALSMLSIDFMADVPSYHYYCNLGRAFRDFRAHLRGTPDGMIEFVGTSA